jgi:hypothetical protein
LAEKEGGGFKGKKGSMEYIYIYICNNFAGGDLEMADTIVMHQHIIMPYLEHHSLSIGH